MNEIPQVTVSELTDDGFVLDIREQDEWDAGHAPGAAHLPMGEIPSRLGEIAALPDDGPVAVICRSGGRSLQAVAWLNYQGFETVNVAGGMRAWAAAGKPLIAAEGPAYVR